MRLLNKDRVNVVAGNGHLRQVGQKVDEQDLLGQHRQKGQQERCAGHAEHVAEIGARRHVDVFERVRKGGAPLHDATMQHRQVFIQQQKAGRLLGDVGNLGLAVGDDGLI